MSRLESSEAERVPDAAKLRARPAIAGPKKDDSPGPSAASPLPSRSALILAFAAIYVIWGSTYLGIRIAVQTIPPFAMAGIRFIVAGALLFGYLKLRGAAMPTWRQWQINTAIGTLLLLGGNGLVAWAEQTVPSGLTALLIGVQPLLFVLVEWAWPGGTRPGGITFAALLLGFAGVAWLAAPWESAAARGVDLAGVGVILLACAFWAYGSIYSRHAKHGADPLVAAALQMLGGGVAITIAAALTGELGRFHPATVSLDSWLALGYLIAVGSLVGYSTFVWLIKHSTPARVATYAYVNPVVAVFLGWLILREPITHRTIVASIVIVAAVVIITAQKNRASKTDK